jgi:hypothetical protein
MARFIATGIGCCVTHFGVLNNNDQSSHTGYGSEQETCAFASFAALRAAAQECDATKAYSSNNADLKKLSSRKYML